VLGLPSCHGIDTGVESQGLPRCRPVAAASGRPLHWQKSVVGEGAFTHEAGIHVDGLLKDPANYQGFDPRLKWAGATASCSASIPARAPCSA
jgi:homocitrate synthase NifV